MINYNIPNWFSNKTNGFFKHWIGLPIAYKALIEVIILSIVVKWGFKTSKFHYFHISKSQDFQILNLFK